MKAKVTYTFTEIDLTDFGHDEDTKFEDLTEHDITDTLAAENNVQVSVKTIEP